MSPIVRIAPSPTGPLHIGTARTALFNYLFAAQARGQFLLRIEDTDTARSKKEFEHDIIDGLKWLGIHWHGQIVYQSKRRERYHAIAQEMIKKGFAQQRDGAIYYKIHNSSLAGADVQFDDLIRGPMRFAVEELEDFVILKSDGNPTYHFAVVVDDEAMDITHVIRGEDHLSNTPKHILMQRALGYRVPTYGHLPLIINADRTKMSKRKDPVSVTKDFRAEGYLPEAMLNFMALLGWNPGGGEEQEFFSLSELIERFSFEHVGRSPSVFDLGRLQYFNAHAIRQMDDAKLVKLISQLAPLPKASAEFLQKVVAVSKSRLTTLKDFPAQTTYFFAAPKAQAVEDNLIFKKSNRETTLKGLEAAIAALSGAPEATWQTAEKLSALLLDVVSRATLTNGDVFWPVRVALCGEQASPSPGELLWVLQKTESLKRLKEALRLLKPNHI